MALLPHEWGRGVAGVAHGAPAAVAAAPTLVVLRLSPALLETSARPASLLASAGLSPVSLRAVT